jgi:methionine-rich copper-binding protein CopC
MMFNKITLICTLLFFLLAPNVLAHSNLADSTPKNGEVLTHSLKDITLSYETDLEPTSSFTLVDENGKVIPLSPISIHGSELIGTLEEELLNGAYSIHWKIIGTDGHQLEGDIPFTVQRPESTPTSVENETIEAAAEDTENAAIETTEKTEEVIKEQAAPLSNTDGQVEPSLKAYIVPGSIVLIIVLGFASYWLIFRRKQV